MRHIVIVYKHGRQDAGSFAGQLKEWLEARDARVQCRENPEEVETPRSQPILRLPDDAEVAIVLGGDGTFLSVARALQDRSTPIIGVNLGGLGFLTEISREMCFQDLDEILAGKYDTEDRMRLQVSIQRGQREIFRQTVLNDVVINKGALARIIDLKATIDGRYLTNYRADGLIVATPTGSTAYNLSAGGPIVYPTARAIVVTPICPFTLTNRPIILPADVQVQVEMGDRVQDVSLTCDGQVGSELAPADRVQIISSPTPLRLIKPQSTDYFEILRTKLKWGQN
ncbi:MAG TPA: NAD(+) kinase [Syntrophobacteraceae bacterium]|nr:NAD(+) kinase [Syntrophobacteraceae bacterium]HBZ54802.1 NAD(+) kinase [Syntrophobacteraceae bacterium]